jgi:pimeloyl-ACP methyl ester carboxylesterase
MGEIAMPVGAPRRRRRRWPWVVGGLAGTAVVALAALALLAEDVPYQADWSEAAVDAVAGTDAVPAHVAHDCPFAADAEEVTCGTLLVPLRHDDPGGPTIALAVARLHATGPAPAPDPIVYLEGGPGGFAVADHAWWAEEMDALLADRDVILLDQRGVGYSEPSLVCTELHEEPWDDDPGTAELLATRACHDRLVADGVDLSAFSTPAIAADVAALRTAMGFDEVNLLGVSYGTRVALAVLRDHPVGIRSVVLDSVYPLEVRALEEQVVFAAAAIDHVLDRCAAETACATAHPDVAATLDAVIAELDAAPVDVGDEVVDGGALANRIFDALYAPEALTRVPAAVGAAADGDVAQALDLLDGDADPGRRRVWADEDSDGLFHSVTCREELAVSDPEVAAARAGTVRPALRDALVGDVERTYAICGFWDAGRAAPAESEPVRSDVPALILAGAYDPITPAVWAEGTAEVLDRATYVGFADLGHAVFAGGDCPLGIVAAFLAAPTGPPDAACASR